MYLISREYNDLVNNKGVKNLFVMISCLIVVVVYFYLQNHNKSSLKSPVDSLINTRLLALLANTSSTRSLGERSKTSNCHVRGPLPDPTCTPGAIFEDVTLQEICVSGYTKTVRNVSVGLKAQVYAEYGLSYPQARNSYEADHLIPLELGGNNDIANLFPEAARPTPGFREKDLLENYLHDEACAHRIDLSAAQIQIARDWVAAYNTLTPEILAKLRARF